MGCEHDGPSVSASRPSVLIVEDDRATAHLLDLYFRREGFETIVRYDGRTGLDACGHPLPDLIILDVMLPEVDGLALCGAVRQVANTPIIFISSRTRESDRLAGFHLGADDYVSKPFSPLEVVARARAVLRRSNAVEHPPGPLKEVLGDIRVDYRLQSVSVRDTPVHLTPTEYRLLCVFIHEPGRTYTRRMLAELALGSQYEGLERTIDAHIRNLRRKVEPNPAVPIYIITVFGVGYRMNATGST